MLKFPRTTLSPGELKRVEDYFLKAVRPLREGSSAEVFWLPFDSIVGECLRVTSRTGRLTQGLEAIAKLLDDEKKGLLEVQQKTNQPVANRMSRLLFISNDGSERFLNQVEGLLTRHQERLSCVRLEASAEDLGGLLTVRGNPTKALLIDDKKALGLFLTELVRALEKNDE